MSITLLKARLRSKELYTIFPIWFIATALNLNKAFHIDDTFHIEAAQWIQNNPFKPMSGLINWDNVSEPIYNFNQPPLYFYLLALVGSLVGYAEVPLHLFQSVFVFISLYFFHKLLCCYNKEFAIVGTAFLGLGPAFLVNQNLMVDIPILSLSITFIYTLVKDDQLSKTKDLIIAAIILSIGLLIKYSLLPLVLVLIFSIWRKNQFKFVLVLLVPTLTLLAWSLFNKIEFGNSHILGRPRNSISFQGLLFNSTSFLIILGSISPFTFLFYNGYIKSKTWKFINITGGLTIILTISAYLLVFGFEVKSLPYKFFWIAFLSNGFLFVIVFCLITSRLLHSFKYQILILWVFCQSAFIVLFAPFMATRHVLLILPALIIICGHVYSNVSIRVRKYSVIITCFLGFYLSVSDWIYADFYRDSATKAISMIPKNSKIWTAGHWGWQWYSKQAGMNFYEYELSQVREGDFFIAPSVISRQNLENNINLKKITYIVYKPSIFNLLTTANFASFYNTTHVQLPWYISISPKDTVTIYSVKEINR